MSTLRQRLLVNRGGTHGVFKAQAVVTGDGVLGQVFRIGPCSSEIILITDPEHALPVQVVRSGVRTIALGTGRSTALELPYVPQNYDVKVGDLLVTSGLGRCFPSACPWRVLRKWNAIPTSRWRRSMPCRWPASKTTARCCSSGNAPAIPAATASPEALAVEVPAPAVTKP